MFYVTLDYFCLWGQIQKKLKDNREGIVKLW
jgi:hypothetical protein